MSDFDKKFPPAYDKLSQSPENGQVHREAKSSIFQRGYQFLRRHSSFCMTAAFAVSLLWFGVGLKLFTRYDPPLEMTTGTIRYMGAQWDRHLGMLATCRNTLRISVIYDFDVDGFSYSGVYERYYDTQPVTGGCNLEAAYQLARHRYPVDSTEVVWYDDKCVTNCNSLNPDDFNKIEYLYNFIASSVCFGMSAPCVMFYCVFSGKKLKETIV